MANNYMNNAEKAQDNRSSGWTLLITGSVGLIAIILIALGVIPLSMSSFTKTMITIVLGSLCVIFIIMGFVSFKNSKEYATKAEAEGDRESRIINWFKENCPAEKIDEMLGQELDGLSEEEAYFRRFAMVRQIVYNQFPDIGTEFHEHMSDEVYETLFGEE